MSRPVHLACRPLSYSRHPSSAFFVFGVPRAPQPSRSLNSFPSVSFHFGFVRSSLFREMITRVRVTAYTFSGRYDMAHGSGHYRDGNRQFVDGWPRNRNRHKKHESKVSFRFSHSHQFRAVISNRIWHDFMRQDVWESLFGTCRNAHKARLSWREANPSEHAWTSIGSLHYTACIHNHLWAGREREEKTTKTNYVWHEIATNYFELCIGRSLFLCFSLDG